MVITFESFAIFWIACGLVAFLILLKQQWKTILNDGFYPGVAGFLFVVVMGAFYLYAMLDEMYRKRKRKNK